MPEVVLQKNDVAPNPGVLVPEANYRNYKICEKFTPYVMQKFEGQSTPISVPTCSETSTLTKVGWAGAGAAFVIIILELFAHH